MTPAEKAIELLTKYRRHLPVNTVTDLEAKECALMAVNEMIKLIDSLYTGEKHVILDNLEDIKQEIEKL